MARKYTVIKDATAEFVGEPVEAESIREACHKLGFSDFDVQSDDFAIAWVNDEAYSVSPQ